MIGELIAQASEQTDSDGVIAVEHLIGAIAGIAAAVGATKIPNWLRNFNIRKAARKADQIATNLDTLADYPLEDIIGEAVVRALADFKADQQERDRAAWAHHDSCHEQLDTKVDKLGDGHDSLAATLTRMDKNLSYIQGQLKAK